MIRFLLRLFGEGGADLSEAGAFVPSSLNSLRRPWARPLDSVTPEEPRDIFVPCSHCEVLVKGAHTCRATDLERVRAKSATVRRIRAAAGGGR